LAFQVRQTDLWYRNRAREALQLGRLKEPWICPMDTRDQPQTDDDSEPEYILAL
jgi:hypothetical protein